MFIKNLFEGKNPEELQQDFLKFSRGDFKDRYLIEAKNQKDRVVIKTSSEFANYLVRTCIENSNEKEINVSGVIVSTFDIREKMGGFVFNPEEEVKQFMGIKQLKVNGKISTEKLIKVMDMFPRGFFALSFSVGKSELKIKPKAPKSAKPSTKGDKEVGPDFCMIKTSDSSIIRELLFDCSTFKEVKIRHTIKIKEIVYPKNEKDPIKARENSRRSGEIIRHRVIDGKTDESTANFVA